MGRSLKNIYHLLVAVLAVIYYRYPSRKMTVIGVTGTDGKTTTSNLIYSILKASGKKVSIVSTVSAVINGRSYDTGFHVTTPSSWALQKYMKQALDGGCRYFILEVTSHAIDQHRIFGSSIDISVITNISHEHLDYHKTFDNYRKTKAKILSRSKFSILNVDDDNFEFLKKKVTGHLVTYGINGQADNTPSVLKSKPPLQGKYNLYNILAAVSVARILGINAKSISKGLSDFIGVPGRLEKIKSGTKYSIFIDFAHKPHALESVLTTLRPLTKNKLIVVFGCAGERDRLKRPMMGEIAARLSDYAVLTAEDPRTEDVRNIIGEIAAGCLKKGMIEMEKSGFEGRLTKKEKKYFWRIPDRQEAVNFAVRKLASTGDLILVTGKGHETSMCYGKTEYPWSDKSAIEKALYGTVKTAIGK